MKLKLRINGKMLLYILGTTIVVYGSAFSYIAFKLRSNNYNNSFQILENKSIEIKSNTQKIFNNYIESALVLSQTFSEFDKLPENSRREEFSNMMHSALMKNPDYLSVWTEWKPSSIDNLDSLYKNTIGSTVLGNFDNLYYRIGDSIFVNENFQTDSAKVCNGTIFSRIEKSMIPELIEPYLYSYTNNKEDEILEINMVTPIMNNNRFVGVIGIDISMDLIQQTFSELNHMNGGKYYVITNGGDFLINPDTSYLRKAFNDFAPNIENKFNITNSIKEGKSFDFIAEDPTTGENSLFIFKTIDINNLNTPWSFCISAPLKSIYKEANKSLTYTIIIALIGFVIILLVIMGIAYSISDPIQKTTRVLQDIAHGNIKNVNKLRFFFNDEINDLTVSINKLIKGLNSSAQFAQQIGEGDLNADYKLLGDKDALGMSLIAMQKSLTTAKKAEDEKRIEDEKRNWVTHGLAKFGEVIRQHNDDMEKFTMNIAQNLVDYIGISQIAIYINKQIENESSSNDRYELKATIAYGKTVMLNKEFEKGDELLGRAVDEVKTIYMKELPEEYVLLSPGMKNEKRPKNLLIIPIHINDISMGVLELLSFEYFKDYQIDFLEKLCENIASVISSVKTNISTANLLEQSQFQADELAQHEEEMRQNLEEMQATQEEAAKRQEELKIYINAVKSTVMVAELDYRGRIIDMSPSMSVVYGANIENMRGNYFEGFVAQDKASQAEFAKFWEGMIQTGASKRKHVVNQRNNKLYLLESYKVIKKEGLQPKVIILVVDKTKEKETNDLLKAELNKK